MLCAFPMEREQRLMLLDRAGMTFAAHSVYSVITKLGPNPLRICLLLLTGNAKCLWL